MIRIILTLVITIFSYIISFAQETTYNITANFYGMKNNDGKLFVALYNTKDSFLKKPFKTAIVDIKELKSSVTFSDLPKNNYAISTFHDKNNNGKMDTNFFGIPKEAIGTSNDAKGTFGPPKFKDAKFIVDKTTSLTIKVAKLF